MSDVLKGAAGLAALIPGVGPIIGTALGIADALGAGAWLSEHVLGDKGSAVAQAVIQATVAATGGATDPAAIAGLPPERAAELRVQLAQIAAQQADAARAAVTAERAAELERIKAALADTASARAQTVALAQTGSRMQWAPVVVSVIVLGTFGVVMWAALTRSLPAGSETVLNMLLGTLAAMATATVSYWVGSSAGSAQKTDMLYRSTPPSSGGDVSRPLSR